VVLRARDVQTLARAKRAVEDMLERVRGAQSSGASSSPGADAVIDALKRGYSRGDLWLHPKPRTLALVSAWSEF
jgi:hypothetical protein